MCVAGKEPDSDAWHHIEASYLSHTSGHTFTAVSQPAHTSRSPLAAVFSQGNVICKTINKVFCAFSNKYDLWSSTLQVISSAAFPAPLSRRACVKQIVLSRLKMFSSDTQQQKQSIIPLHHLYIIGTSLYIAGQDVCRSSFMIYI